MPRHPAPPPTPPSPQALNPGASGPLASDAQGTSAPHDPPAPATELPAPPAPATEAPPDLDFDKLYAARLLAARARPYLASALFALHVVPSRYVPTMAVDPYWRCYVAPAFVVSTPVEELASVWVHEVSHLLRDHHGRGEKYAREHDAHGPAERLRRNIAADCEINDDAFGDGLPVPQGAVTPRMLLLQDGQLMETYLEQIRLGRHTERLKWLDCGSGVDGHGRAWDLGPGGSWKLSPHERDAVRFRVAEGIRGRPGDVPEGWRRWAEEAFQPPQPWRQLLGAAVRAAAASGGTGGDYTYGRPGRRSASVPGAVLPSLRRTPPRVCVIVDTSGSVSDAELGAALREIAAISAAVGGRRDLVGVLACDAAAGTVRPLAAAHDIPLIGGGGTDLREGFRQALRSRPSPDVVVALTDGQTPWPEHAPPCRSVIGLFHRPSRVDEDDPDYHPTPPPDWARVVTIG
ncbi:VWA-like domain-containing protein [Streptomyces sp. NPDC021020]|uniref:vWA domain-containing protein n=1 Tax=Streptomyces sp. NPDC021020 TaxID=3365109 RepID=UPI0037B865CA